MSALTYQQQVTVGATGIDLVVALYDGALRFLYRAKQSVLDDDVLERRIAVKKVVDILMYLQARLRPDLGADAATALSDFYATMFTLTLEASHDASEEGFDEVIHCIRNVREAWFIAARDPEAGRVLPRELRTREERFVVQQPTQIAEATPRSARWSA